MCGILSLSCCASEGAFTFTLVKKAAALTVLSLFSPLLAINIAWGMREMGRYVHQIELARAGVSLSAEDFAEKKEATNLHIIQQDNTMLSVSSISRGYPVDPGSLSRLLITGPMAVEGGMCAYGIREQAEMLMDADQNSNIAGHFIEVHSGGGEAHAGHVLHEAIQSLTKPVLVHSIFAGSAAIHGTLAATEIWGNGKAAEFGSIGTYAMLSKELIKSLGEDYIFVTSDLSPDKNASILAVVEGNLEPLRAEVNENAALFRDNVRAFRPLKGGEKKITKTLSGGMFLANDARSRGLIDGICNRRQAITRLQQLVNRA